MKKIILALILFASAAHADNTSDLMGLGMSSQLAGKVDEIYSSAVTSSIIPATNDSVEIGSETKGLKNIAFAAAAVITPSTSFPTPTAGNTLSKRHTILAAGAPTAAYVALPVTASNVGKTFKVYNQGSNPLAIVPQTGTVNVSAALTPYSCSTLQECTCTALTSANWGCHQ